MTEACSVDYPARRRILDLSTFDRDVVFLVRRRNILRAGCCSWCPRLGIFISMDPGTHAQSASVGDSRRLASFEIAQSCNQLISGRHDALPWIRME